jgi:hypothetical protein
MVRAALPEDLVEDFKDTLEAKKAEAMEASQILHSPGRQMCDMAATQIAEDTRALDPPSDIEYYGRSLSLPSYEIDTLAHAGRLHLALDVTLTVNELEYHSVPMRLDLARNSIIVHNVL